MFKLIVLILGTLLIQLNEINAIKQLINFQVFEEDAVYRSILNVHSFVNLNAELKLINDVDSEQIYNCTIELKQPIQLKIDGKLSKLKENELKEDVAKGEKTFYRLNLNVENQFGIDLNVNHTKRNEDHEFTSDLDFNSFASKITGKYLGTLLMNGRCPKLTLFHNFTTNIENLINFSSNLTEECNQLNATGESEDRMRITIDFSTLMNDLFDFKLDQLFVKQLNRGSELMTLLNKIYKIKVIGDYNYFNETANKQDANSLNYQFHKKAIFESSLPNQFPTFQIKYANGDRAKNKMKLSFEIKNDQYRKVVKDEL